MRTEPQAVHGWQLLPDFLPESKRSISALAAWSRANWDCLHSLDAVERLEHQGESFFHFLVGGRQRWCQSEGMWDAQEPKHQHPGLPSGRVSTLTSPLATRDPHRQLYGDEGPEASNLTHGAVGGEGVLPCLAPGSTWFMSTCARALKAPERLHRPRGDHRMW